MKELPVRKDRLISEVLGQEHALSPSDLINADLRTVIIGGYDKIEVDALLERAADVLERFAEENRRLRGQLDDQRDQVQQHQEMEITLRNAIISAHKAGETLIESARSQAEALIEEARLEKARARFQAEQLPEALRDEMRRLHDERDRLRADIEAVLRAHESMLQRLPRAEERQQAALRQESRGHYIGFEDDHGDAAPDSPALQLSRASRPEIDSWETGNEDGEEQE
jgi:DivIVA domain-containing protein